MDILDLAMKHGVFLLRSDHEFWGNKEAKTQGKTRDFAKLIAQQSGRPKPF